MIAQTIANNSIPKHQHNKTPEETITQTNFATIKIMRICFQRELFHSRCPNQLGQVMICQDILTALSFLGENGREVKLQEEILQATWKENFNRTICGWSNGNHNGRWEWPIYPGPNWQCNRWRWLNGTIGPALQLDVTHVWLTRTGHHCHQWSLSTRKKHYLPGHNSKPNNSSTIRHRDKSISCFGQFPQGITSNMSIIKSKHKTSNQLVKPILVQ